MTDRQKESSARRGAKPSKEIVPPIPVLPQNLGYVFNVSLSGQDWARIAGFLRFSAGALNNPRTRSMARELSERLESQLHEHQGMK